MFLNEWGDCQVVPYKLNRDMSPHGESEEELVHASQRRKSTQPDSSNSSAPRHYGIFVDENKIRVSWQCYMLGFTDPVTLTGIVIWSHT